MRNRMNFAQKQAIYDKREPPEYHDKGEEEIEPELLEFLRELENERQIERRGGR